MEKEKSSLKVAVNVTATNYQNGNVFEAQGKLKTVFGGKGQIEESLTFHGSDCGKPNMEVDYNSSFAGAMEQTNDVELDIKGRVLNSKKELIDIVGANAKIAKTEVITENVRSEEWLRLKMENSCDAKCATTESFYTHKISEI